jgi:hypothetical protein
LLLYLLNLSKFLKDQLPRTLKQFEEVYTMEQQPPDVMRKWVQEETTPLMVMYDA